MIPSVDFDFRDPAYREDPLRFYRELRELGPLALDGHGSVLVVGHAECKRALNDRDAVHKCPEKALAHMPPGPFRDHNANTLAFMDPPTHTRVRKGLAHVFTPRALAELEPVIRSLADDILRDLKSRDKIDFIADIAEPLPLYVICAMLGIPHDQRDLFRRSAHDIVLALEPGASPAHLAAADKAATALQQVIEEQCQTLEPDMNGSVVQRLLAVRESDGLTWSEIVNQAIFLLNAGHETTSTLLGHIARVLLQNKNLAGKLSCGNLPVDGLIEEVLRLCPPLHFTRRQTTDALELAGENIPAGTTLLILIGAANTDPLVFDDPETLDPERFNSKAHLSFASGIHICLGAALARLEARVALEAMKDLFNEFELAAPPVENEAVLFQGLSSLPLRRIPVLTQGVI